MAGTYVHTMPTGSAVPTHASPHMVASLCACGCEHCRTRLAAFCICPDCDCDSDREHEPNLAGGAT